MGFIKGFTENAFIDPFIGFGLRNRNFDDVAGTINGSVSIYTIGNQKDIVLFLSLGMKVGILF